MQEVHATARPFHSNGLTRNLLDTNLLETCDHRKMPDGVRYKPCATRACTRATLLYFRKTVFLELAKGFEPPTL